MASRDYQSEVIDLVADERGLPREKVHLSDRLLQDLGMDGDDAVDFFISVHERFGTDLADLQEHWTEHFGPEGFSWLNGLVIIPAALIGGVVGGLVGPSKFWSYAVGFTIAVALLAAWLWVMRRLGPPDRMVPVTVQEVVAAVEEEGASALLGDRGGRGAACAEQRSNRACEENPTPPGRGAAESSAFVQGGCV